MCTKKRFATRAGALLKLAEIKHKGEIREKNPIREYFCRFCGGYHLTSQPMSKKKESNIASRKERMPDKIAELWVKKKGW
jgi:hypothetical protein